MTAPVLAFPDFTIPFLIETDASDVAISGVLAQKRLDSVINKEVLNPVAYFSRKLNAAQV